MNHTHPAKILYGMFGRPRYIAQTRPSGSDSPKCFTLGLGRLAGFSHGIDAKWPWTDNNFVKDAKGVRQLGKVDAFAFPEPLHPVSSVRALHDR